MGMRGDIDGQATASVTGWYSLRSLGGGDAPLAQASDASVSSGECRHASGDL